MNLYVMELNASCDRGIDVVRDRISQYAMTKSPLMKLIILDEVDAMTIDAQNALKRLMEKYTKKCRFCLICNNKNKIIAGLKSRCTMMRFGLLKPEAIKSRVMSIIDAENINIEEDAVIALIKILKDFRQILNTLQCMHYVSVGKYDGDGLYDEITVDDIYDYLGKPSDKEVEQVHEMLLYGTYIETHKYIMNIVNDNRWNISDLINELCMWTIKHDDIDEPAKMNIIQDIAKIESRVAGGHNISTQLASLIASYHLYLPCEDE